MVRRIDRMRFCARICCSLTLVGLFFLPLFVASAQATSPVADYVRAEMQRQHIPGAALLVVRRGKIERAEGFGLANVELQVPVKAETIFQSGSMGKQFTATAVMMLVG